MSKAGLGAAFELLCRKGAASVVSFSDRSWPERHFYATHFDRPIDVTYQMYVASDT